MARDMVLIMTVDQEQFFVTRVSLARVRQILRRYPEAGDQFDVTNVPVLETEDELLELFGE